jgi:hypothetical protein
VGKVRRGSEILKNNGLGASQRVQEEAKLEEVDIVEICNLTTAREDEQRRVQ